MELQLFRKKSDGDTTLGILHGVPGVPIYTLEDQHNATLVRGETRIHAGMYEIKFRKVLSPLTIKYRDRFEWFSWHLELQSVGGRNFIYIHPGFDDDDTDGCILIGYGVDTKKWTISRSREAFRDFYFYVSGALKSGSVFITIYDEMILE